jgi:hypothetical protein
VNPPEFFAILFLFGGGLYVLRPIASALAKRIAGEVPARRDDELHDTVLAELRHLRDEMGALAERVDFTERMLAQQRESERLAPPR